MRNRIERYRAVPTGAHRQPGPALTDRQQIAGAVVLALIPSAIVALVAQMISLLT